ncbi:MAG TPA: wax ester/triacylglycerol synthase domain-containing protein, partial [Acidimicrobiales bacterium]|nr:wax ester/triacylglycerol synthase domain-containing protein [Acidimicrobiales bacterium]
DRSPDWDRLRARVELASGRAPLFRARVEAVPGRLAVPRWVEDPTFDLDWHLRRVGAPPPHTPRTVLDIARHEAETDFDRARPLWQFTLVEGLVGERAAFVMKLHHALTDGLGGVELALLLFDRQACAPARSEAHQTAPGAPGPGRDGGEDRRRPRVPPDLARLAGVVAGAARHVLPAARQVALHPMGSIVQVVGDAGSIYRAVAPVRQVLSPLMQERGTGRHLAMLECSLADLTRAAHAGGGSVNDAFLASVTGGLRRYHEHNGVGVEELRVTLPISIRRPGDPLGGNRITLLRLPLGVAEADPRARIGAHHRRCRRAGGERSLAYTDAIAGTLNLFPPGVVGSILRRVDFVASDVTGFPFPVFLGGARVERYVAFPPTIGASLNVTLLSYDGTCCIGVNVDTAAVGDTDVLLGCLAEGFEEVLALSGAHQAVAVGPFNPGA